MALNASGEISLGGPVVGQSVNLELGKLATALISMNDSDLRSLFGVASGQISMSDGYGKSLYDTNSTRGYFVGGGPVSLDQIDGIQFSNETAIDPAAALVQARTGAAGVNNPARGYTGGGGPTTQGGQLNQIDGLQFSNETAIDPAAALVQARTGLVGVNSTTRGYFMSGSSDGSPTLSLQIDGIQFSDETAIDPAASLTSRTELGDSAHGVTSTTAGYMHGNTPTLPQTYQKFIFATETSTTGGAYSPQTGRRGAANSLTKGYFAGGGNSGPDSGRQSSIHGLTFSTDTGSLTSAALAQARSELAGTNSSTRGYFSGGDTQPFLPARFTTQIDGIIFSSETAIDPAAALAQARMKMASYQNSNN